MTTAELPKTIERIVERAATDFEWYAEHFLKIVNKQGRLIPFELNAGQKALLRALLAMREAGIPMRVIILKARQMGFSTLIQGLVIWRTTLQSNHSAYVIAHDLETGAKLFAIGRRMYQGLPDSAELPGLKPPVSAFKRSRFMHFGATGDSWQHESGLDSEYNVSTAGETESGRGGTYRTIHGSEIAFWADIEGKTTALESAVPEDPDTLVAWEGTANGFNAFKDRWDDAEAGRSDYLAFFWPWWKHEEYRLEFMDEAEREEFRVGDTDQSPYAEREPMLVNPGPVDSMTGEHVPLDLEQLKWRRWAVANKGGGKLSKFDQEFPTEPDDAFLSTGQFVFEPVHVRRIEREAKQIKIVRHGALVATERKIQAGRYGKVEVPAKPKWQDVHELMPGISPEWKLWLELEEDPKTRMLRPPPDRCYCMGVDVSGGVSESGDEGDPAYHAIEVIDHESRKQVAEFHSRCDTPLLSEFVFLTAMFFNEAWLAVEVTGGWGLPVARTVTQDWRYRFSYRRKTHERSEDHEQDRLGWDTTRATKPILLANGEDLIRGDDHGIQSVELAREMLTYIKIASGKTAPEKGKFADRLMAWLIAHQIADELPVRKRKKLRVPRRQARDPVTGY